MKNKQKRAVVSVATSPDPYISIEDHASNTPLNINLKKNPIEEINVGSDYNQFQYEEKILKSKLTFDMKNNHEKNENVLPQVSQTINVQNSEKIIE